MALLVHPGTMRHVDLDPVRAVLQLLTRDLAQLHRPIAKLRALGHHDIGIVAFQRISAGDRDGARNHQQARAGDKTGVDRLLDADVAVTGALGFQVAQRGESLLQGPAH